MSASNGSPSLPERRITEGGPAFPRAGCNWTKDYGASAYPQDGMTLRDWFAGQYLRMYFSSVDEGDEHVIDPPTLARFAYQVADAMLAERNHKTKGGAS